MKYRFAVLAMIATSVVPTLAHAQTPCALAPQPTAASVSVCVNGSALHTFRLSQDGPLSGLAPTRIDLGNGASFTIGAQMDADPFAHFSFGSVLPSGFGPLSFDAYFTTPVSGGPYNTAASFAILSMSAGSTTGAPTTGLVTAGSASYYIGGDTNVGNLGVNLGTTSCMVTNPPSPSATVCDYGTATSTFSGITPAFLTAHLSYTHNTTGNGSSVAGWVGGVDLTSATTVVPEPSTMLLSAAGLLMVFAIRTRKRG